MIQPEKVKRPRIRMVRIDNESLDSEEDESVSDDVGSEDEDFDAMLEQQETSDDEGTAAVKPQPISLPNSTEDGEGTSSLPYVFDMPSSYEDLVRLLQPHSASEILTVIERLVKCHHPSLKEGNKKRLARLFLYLLRFYDSLSVDGAGKIDTLGVLIKCLYSLMKFDIEYAARCVRALLRQQWKAHLHDRRAVFGFRAVSLVRLVAALFPVSDFSHPVCTPTLAFAVSLVGTVRVTCIRIAARILVLIAVIIDYVTETRRYIPEVIAFMRGLLLMGVENRDEESSPTATFPISLPHRRMLFIENDGCVDKTSLMLKIADVFDDDLSSFEDTNENRLSVLRFAIALLCRLVSLYSIHHYSFKAIFGPFGDLLKRLPSQRYPSLLRAELEEAQACITAECDKNSTLKQLQKTKQRKKMLEMLEPRFDESFNAERSRNDTVKGGKKAEDKKLRRKYKKEMRGAMRELRKDNQFIAREKRREVEANDRMRRKKTKELLHSLQGQESEYKKNMYMKQAPRK
ncbi:Nucleolar protein 14 [Toxocara canis]|uniref:Nucleolar protein 14 n=1 Tax=Toxocara canis TaxID=6265 RepID=A0A0B2V9Z9_TOXCA|nr:Nucleolar protein 14 [Toxocara canis]